MVRRKSCKESRGTGQGDGAGRRMSNSLGNHLFVFLRFPSLPGGYAYFSK